MCVQRSQGFTLLEILLALSLSALIMLTLAGGMHLVFKDWERSSDYLDTSLETVLLLLQIERSLTGAFSHTYFDKKENIDHIFFEGEAEKLTWVSTVSPGHKAGLTAWQLTVEEKGLSLRTTPAFAGNPTDTLEEMDPVATLEGYKASFEYLYVDNKIQGKEEHEWVTEWLAKELKGLPKAVRIRLENQKDSKDVQEIIAFIAANEHFDVNRFRPLKPQK